MNTHLFSNFLVLASSVALAITDSGSPAKSSFLSITNSNSLFSQLENAILKHERVFNMSGGEQIRDYLPVESVAEYIVKISLQNNITGVINCSSGKPVKLTDLIEQFIDERTPGIELNKGFYPYPDYEPMAFWGDNSKLTRILNIDSGNQA